MGTSSSYKAPTSGGWPAAKRVATRYAQQQPSSGTATSVEPKDVFAAYIEAHGGARGAASSAGAAKSSAARLGGILDSISSDGLSNALRNAGLTDLVGKSPSEILAAIVDLAVGPGSSIDEAVARAAMIEVLEDEFGDTESFTDLENAFSGLLMPANVMSVIYKFLVEYIYRRIVAELGERITNGAISAAVARQKEEDLRQYIEQSVKFELHQAQPDELAWNRPAASQMVERLLRDAYGQL
ncbi:Qat anti-phage system associated protein QatB [Sorangium cellulosum]|uniref:Qat anti-phage system associated protein QatB n=1 Tax=Sorangium cellulosum TaxID=56 RepID=UPI000320D98B|nr:Qat anti-phage system associated protein QatB [Sorangium cellulosum]